MSMHILSDTSLGYLDQAPALKKRDAKALSIYIESLSRVERTLFLSCLKEENKILYNEHMKFLEGVRKKTCDEQEKLRVKWKKEKDKKAKDPIAAKI